VNDGQIVVVLSLKSLPGNAHNCSNGEKTAHWSFVTRFEQGKRHAGAPA